MTNHGIANSTSRVHEYTSTRGYEGTRARGHEYTSTRVHEYTSARVHEGTRVRGHEGTRARVHEGTRARGHEGTRARGRGQALTNAEPPVVVQRQNVSRRNNGFCHSHVNVHVCSTCVGVWECAWVK